MIFTLDRGGLSLCIVGAPDELYNRDIHLTECTF